MEDLIVLKTTRSSFSGFPRDAYTTLPDTDDRMAATKLTAIWRYGSPDVDADASFEAIRTDLLETWADHDSPSIQTSIWIIARAILERHDEVQEIRMVLPNLHHWLVDLSRRSASRTTARSTRRRPSRTGSSRRPCVAARADVTGTTDPTALPDGVEVTGPAVPGSDRILTPEALAFVADLQRRFGSASAGPPEATRGAPGRAGRRRPSGLPGRHGPRARLGLGRRTGAARPR